MAEGYQLPRGGTSDLLMVTTCECPACGREMVKQTAEGRARFCMFCGARFVVHYSRPKAGKTPSEVSDDLRGVD